MISEIVPENQCRKESLPRHHLNGQSLLQLLFHQAHIKCYNNAHGIHIFETCNPDNVHCRHDSANELKIFTSVPRCRQVTPSPLFPLTNSKAEVRVLNVKRLLEKATASNSHP